MEVRWFKKYDKTTGKLDNDYTLQMNVECPMCERGCRWVDVPWIEETDYSYETQQGGTPQ